MTRGTSSAVIGLVQTRMSVSTSGNLERATAGIERAAGEGARIICLPELFRTQYFPREDRLDVADYAESIPGESTEVIRKLARALGVVVVAPLFEEHEG